MSSSKTGTTSRARQEAGTRFDAREQIRFLTGAARDFNSRFPSNLHLDRVAKLIRRFLEGLKKPEKLDDSFT